MKHKNKSKWQVKREKDIRWLRTSVKNVLEKTDTRRSKIKSYQFLKLLVASLVHSGLAYFIYINL